MKKAAYYILTVMQWALIGPPMLWVAFWHTSIGWIGMRIGIDVDLRWGFGRNRTD